MSHFDVQEELKCTYFLWQLFHIDQDLKKAQQRMAKEQKALEAAARTGMVADKEIEAKRKVQAGFHLERLQLERQLKRRRTESDQKVTHCTHVQQSGRRGSSPLALQDDQGFHSSVLLHRVCTYKWSVMFHC